MTWQELYTQAITAFGDTPGATLEQDLIDAYTTNPAAVQITITKITQAFKAGKINSPWGAIRTELAKQLAVRTNLNTGSQRQHAVRNAEQWIRTAGLHYDRWTEVHDELFGDRGTLTASRQDTNTLNRLEELWQEVRTTGEHLEQDESDRAAKWIAQRLTPATDKSPAGAHA